MFEATTGDRFEEKAASEFDELEGVQKFVYSLLCIASSQRHYLTRDEILLGCTDVSGDPIDALQRLANRHVIVTVPPANHYRARHRMIADVVFDRMQQQRQLLHPLKNLIVALASKFDVHSAGRGDRLSRILTRLTSHAFLLGLLQLEKAREVYSTVENLLATTGCNVEAWRSKVATYGSRRGFGNIRSSVISPSFVTTLSKGC